MTLADENEWRYAMAVCGQKENHQENVGRVASLVFTPQPLRQKIAGSGFLRRWKHRRFYIANALGTLITNQTCTG